MHWVVCSRSLRSISKCEGLLAWRRVSGESSVSSVMPGGAAPSTLCLHPPGTGRGPAHTPGGAGQKEVPWLRPPGCHSTPQRAIGLQASTVRKRLSLAVWGRALAKRETVC